jgi:hypothetical protein
MLGMMTYFSNVILKFDKQKEATIYPNVPVQSETQSKQKHFQKYSYKCLANNWKMNDRISFYIL